MVEITDPFEYMAALVSGIAGDVRILGISNYRFLIELRATKVQVQFGRDEIDDLAEGLKRNRNSPHFAGLESRVKFRIYTILGREGFLDNLRISDELANEKGDWQPNIRADVDFPKQFEQALSRGLKVLDDALTGILAESTVEVPEIAEDAENIRYLIKYYEKNGHLSSREAEYKSLSYLKGAAICAIATLETERDSTNITRIRKVLNENIYSVVLPLCSAPFDKVAAPECVREFLSHLAFLKQAPPANPQTKTILPENADRIAELLDELGSRYARRRNGAWQAFRSENPDRLSQAANSMVELLDQVIAEVCQTTTLNDFLVAKFGSNDESKWVDATKKWIAETKSNLHRVKHHKDYLSEQLTGALMKNAESVIQLLLSSE
ncbi:MAG: hypothetical protein ACSLE5_13595 [Porticoccaceae bacterium]